MSRSGNDEHWLTRPRTIRRLWWILAVALAALVGVQLLLPVKGYFGIDRSFGFGAWFGFLSCLAMVLVAKAIGLALKRPDDYYDTGRADDD